MRFKKLEKVAKAYGKTLELYPHPGGREDIQAIYVPLAGAMYMVDGLAELTEDLLLTIFDVPQKDWGDWHISDENVVPEVLRPTFRNLTTGERLSQSAMQIWWDTKFLVFWNDRKEAMLIDAALIEPLSGEPENRRYEIFEHEGQRRIVVRDGFRLEAIINPARYSENAAHEIYDLGGYMMHEIGQPEEAEP